MSIEAMKQALEAWDTGLDKRPAMEALRTAIEQAEKQEPVAWISPSGALYRTRYHALANAEQSLTPLYTRPPQRTEQEPVENRFVRELREYAKSNADLPLFPLWNVRRALKYLDGYTRPPQRQWVGLTDEERKELERQSVYVDGAIRMTEAKLKEKNT